MAAAICPLEVPQCSICRSALVGAESDPTTSLLCSHSFHTECLTLYCNSQGKTLKDIRCPNCKLSSRDFEHPDDDEPLARIEDVFEVDPQDALDDDISLFGETDVEEIPAGRDVVEEIPAETDDVEEIPVEAGAIEEMPPPSVAVAKAKGKANAAGKAKSKAKSKANASGKAKSKAKAAEKANSLAVEARSSGKAKSSAKAAVKAKGHDVINILLGRPSSAPPSPTSLGAKAAAPPPPKSIVAKAAAPPPPKSQVAAALAPPSSQSLDAAASAPPPPTKQRRGAKAAAPPPPKSLVATATPAKSLVAAAPPPERSVAAPPPTSPGSSTPKSPGPIALVASDDSIALVASTASTAVVGLGRPTFQDDNSVWCATCGSQCSYEHCRIISKREGTWRCGTCRVRITQLSRGFGTWPVDGFELIPEAEAQAFFRDRALGSQKLSVQSMQALMEKHEKHEEFYQEGGKYLPPDVWARKGYNPVDIVSKSGPDDYKEHPVLGPTYRVRLIETGKRGARGWSVVSQANARGKKRKADALQPPEAPAAIADAPQPLEAPAAIEAAPTPEPSSSSSSSSSSSASSSSSSAKHKKKKGKKDKKKKGKKDKKKKKKKDKKGEKDYAEKAKKALEKAKEQAKLAKEQQKEFAKAEKDAADKKKVELAKEAKDASDKRKVAEQIVNKVSPIILSFAADLAHPSFASLPAACVSSAKSLYRDLEQHDAKARAVIDDASNEFHLGITSIKDLSKVLSDTKRSSTFMGQMFATMGKMPGT